MPELCHYDGYQESVYGGPALHLLSHLGRCFLDYIWSNMVSSLEARDAPFNPTLVCLLIRHSVTEPSNLCFHGSSGDYSEAQLSMGISQ